MEINGLFPGKTMIATHPEEFRQNCKCLSLSNATDHDQYIPGLLAQVSGFRAVGSTARGYFCEVLPSASGDLNYLRCLLTTWSV